MSFPAGLRGALIASIALGIVSTVGDWIWTTYLTDGEVLPALVHGFLFFLVLAVIFGLAAASRSVTRRLVVALPIFGVTLAAAFYPIAAVLGYLPALLCTWFGMWVGLGLLDRWARADEGRRSVTFVRGLAAAVTSGLAFWLVSDLWTVPTAESGYPLRLLYWSFAFLPGFVSLWIGRAPADRSRAVRA